MEEEKILELISIEHRRKALKEEMDALDKSENEIKESFMTELENTDDGVFENEEIRIKYVAPVVRELVDNSKLKKMYPEVAKDCIKQTETKATLKITLKGE